MNQVVDNNQPLDTEAKSLTDWKNPPSLQDLKQDLTNADVSHKHQISRVDRWLDNLNVTGTAKINSGEGRSKHVPQLIRKQAEWRYASLSEPFLNTYDLFDAKPVTWEDREAAIQNKLLLNHQINQKIDKVDFIDSYVRTAVDEGTVIVRVGWEFEEEEVEKNIPVIEFQPDPEMEAVIQELQVMKEQDPSTYALEVPEELQQACAMSMEAGVPLRPIIVGGEVVTEMQTIVNQPTLDVCDYRNIIVDPTCIGKLDNAKFIIYSSETCLADLRKDNKYENLDQIQISDSSVLSHPDHTVEDDSSFTFLDDPRKQLIMYEYWGYWAINGKDEPLVPFVSSWVGNTLIRMEESPFPDKKLPFVKVQYLPVRRRVHGEPDGHLLEENQKISGAVTRGMIDIMARSANGQMGTRKDALDTSNYRKFQRGQDYEFNANIDPRQAFHMHTYPEIPMSAQYMLNLQNMEAESLTGVQAFSQSGLSGSSLGDTATGVNGVLDAASKRESGILRRLAEGLVECGRKIMSMNAEFLDEEEIVRVTNEQFVPVRRDDLGGHIDLSLSISTAEEDNAKAQELSFMLQTVGPNEDPVIRRMVLSDIARLRKMPDLAEKLENYQPEPDPLEQEAKQLQVELLKAQVASEYARAEEREAGGMLDATKAENLTSDTDQKNLDFIEQESGVKQERDLEKQKAQSQGNIELKREEHVLNMENSALDKYLADK
tara:strand:+ start:2070 stop:4211 length:2142 start_codon:yes stop_codon:yes gene_type:complete